MIEIEEFLNLKGWRCSKSSLWQDESSFKFHLLRSKFSFHLYLISPTQHSPLHWTRLLISLVKRSSNTQTRMDKIRVCWQRRRLTRVTIIEHHLRFLLLVASRYRGIWHLPYVEHSPPKRIENPHNEKTRKTLLWCVCFRINKVFFFIFMLLHKENCEKA